LQNFQPFEPAPENNSQGLPESWTYYVSKWCTYTDEVTANPFTSTILDPAGTPRHKAKFYKTPMLQPRLLKMSCH
jgi:hypothetical protein